MLKDWGSVLAFGKFSSKFDSDWILSDTISTYLHFQVEKGADLIISVHIVGIVILNSTSREYHN